LDIKYTDYSYRGLLKARKTALEVEHQWLASISALAKNLPRNTVVKRMANILYSSIPTAGAK